MMSGGGYPHRAPVTVYPSRGDYEDALFDPKAVLLIPWLRTMKPELDQSGLPLSYSGGFGVVFPVLWGGRRWALRCFTADIGDAAEHYRAIQAYPRGKARPYFVDFQFYPQCIRVRERNHPTLIMGWSPGKDLKAFLKDHRSMPEVLRSLADEWRGMLSALECARIAHGDLQHGNIFVEQRPGGLSLFLVDYDTVVIPELEGIPEGNSGLPGFQHPRRAEIKEKYLGVDAFAGIVIYVTLLALATAPELWEEVNVEDREGLLFDREDFDAPESSELLRRLAGLSPELRHLVQVLKDACSMDPRRVRSLAQALEDAPSPDPRDTHPPPSPIGRMAIIPDEWKPCSPPAADAASGGGVEDRRWPPGPPVAEEQLRNVHAELARTQQCLSDGIRSMRRWRGLAALFSIIAIVGVSGWALASFRHSYRESVPPARSSTCEPCLRTHGRVSRADARANDTESPPTATYTPQGGGSQSAGPPASSGGGGPDRTGGPPTAVHRPPPPGATSSKGSRGVPYPWVERL